jgi:quercetin 2,3-dioxygenase
MSLRPVKQIVQPKPTIEGAGVRLQRVFGFGKTKDFDPFLLLDDFRNDNPADYVAGFPWHPHRGIETITYVLAGSVEHGDSLGNKGKMTAGDVQWMTAGSGILHQAAAYRHVSTLTINKDKLVAHNLVMEAMLKPGLVN